MCSFSYVVTNQVEVVAISLKNLLPVTDVLAVQTAKPAAKA